MSRRIPKEFDPRVLTDLVHRPIISEKATRLLEDNKYVFEVDRDANKFEIKAAIESLFGVKVTKVNTYNPQRYLGGWVNSRVSSLATNGQSSPLLRVAKLNSSLMFKQFRS